MWTKICGIQDVDTAAEVAALRPSAIGFVFYGKSPRSLSVEVAEEIVRQTPSAIESVGLFVNESPAGVLARCAKTGIATVQLHGDEPPSFLKELHDHSPKLRLIRAFRMGRTGLVPLEQYLQRCGELGVRPTACLVDALVEGTYGGTGQTVPWRQLADEYHRDEWPQLILAGGLNPDNVREAIEIVQPWGVDVSSGVESAVARKDVGLVKAFLEAVYSKPGPA